MARVERKDTKTHQGKTGHQTTDESQTEYHANKQYPVPRKAKKSESKSEAKHRETQQHPDTVRIDEGIYKLARNLGGWRVGMKRGFKKQGQHRGGKVQRQYGGQNIGKRSIALCCGINRCARILQIRGNSALSRCSNCLKHGFHVVHSQTIYVSQNILPACWLSALLLQIYEISPAIV